VLYHVIVRLGRAYIGNTLRGKNGLHAFGNNSAQSEPIWMKSGTVWAKCGAGPGRFWARSAQYRQFERDRFTKKAQKVLSKSLRLSTSGRHNYSMITDRRKCTYKLSLHGMSSLHFYHSNQFKVFSLGYTFRTRNVFTKIFGNVRYPILRVKTDSMPQCWCGLASDILKKQTELKTENKYLGI